MSISRSNGPEKTESWSELNQWQNDLELQNAVSQYRLDTNDAAISTGDTYNYGVEYDALKGELNDRQVAELVWARRLFFDGRAGTSEDQAFTQGRVDVEARMAIEDNIIINEVGAREVETPGDEGVPDSAWNGAFSYSARYNSIDRCQARVHSARQDTTAGAGHSGQFVAFGSGPPMNYREMGDSDYGPIFENDDAITIFGNVGVDQAGGGPINWKYGIQFAWDVWEAEDPEFGDLRKVI